MAVHYIILAPSYSERKRIALDISAEKIVDEKIVREVLDYLKENCIFSSLSTHVIPTESIDFNSVREHDKYFKDVKIIATKEEFAKILNKDRYLEGIDVANYILSKIHCTHLKLEKLTYFCYANYLCQYDKPLFNDKIYAYKKGPIIYSVYKKFKKTKEILINEEDDSREKFNEGGYLPIRSRLFASEEGIFKVDSINKTLEKYGHLSGQELVALTHKSDSPWNHSGAGQKKYKRIEDDIILKYHRNESI